MWIQVLGILFAVFVACYLPFFAVYVIKGTCGQPCRPYLPPRVLIALEWVAYSGSMLNPIIYHVLTPYYLPRVYTPSTSYSSFIPYLPRLLHLSPTLFSPYLPSV